MVHTDTYILYTVERSFHFEAVKSEVTVDLLCQKRGFFSYEAKRRKEKGDLGAKKKCAEKGTIILLFQSIRRNSTIQQTSDKKIPVHKISLLNPLRIP